MKILLASDAYPPYISGVASYTKDIKLALEKRKHEIKVIAPKYNLSLEENVISVPSFPSIYPSFKIGVPPFRRLYKKVKKFNPDIIHIQTQGTIGLWTANTARKLNKPLIGTYHTYFLYENNFREKGISFLYPAFDKIMWTYNKIFYNKFSGLISPSKILVTYLKSKGINVPIINIPNPIDLKKIEKLKSHGGSATKRFNLGEENILYVGRISYEKNIDNLIRAFKIVNNQRPKSKLIIIGGGPSLDELKKLAKSLGISKKVIFTGAIDRESLFKSGIFPAVDVFATASESENQPLSLIEAMAFGLPVVGVNTMGIPEIITNNGLLSPPGDIKKFAENLDILLSNKALRKKLGQNSRKNVVRYDINTVTDQLINYYKSFLK